MRQAYRMFPKEEKVLCEESKPAYQTTAAD